jgi:hypothetical protein
MEKARKDGEERQKMKAERRLARQGIPLLKEVPRTPIAFLFPGQGSQVSNIPYVQPIGRYALKIYPMCNQ